MYFTYDDCYILIDDSRLYHQNYNSNIISLIGWGSNIYGLHLCSAITPPHIPKECPIYDPEQSNCEAPIWVL